MAIERIIGIDFGTSTSVIRVKRYENGKPVGEELETKEVIFGGRGAMVPTLIMKKDDDPSVTYYGYEAQQKKRKFTNYQSFKVNLESTDVEKRTQARQLTEEFFFYMSKQYRSQSDGGHLGASDDQERTIISYPVKWSEETKRFMITAAKKAGFPNVSGMDEAQAAIHAVTVMNNTHLQQHGLLRNGKKANVLLIDMGAGTTDLVLCCHTPGATQKTEILNTWPKSGKILFGGKEIDILLKNFFWEKMDEADAEMVFTRIGTDKFKTWKEESVSPALRNNDAVCDFEALDNCVEMLNIEMDDYSLNRDTFEKCMDKYLKQLPILINGCLRDANILGADVDLVVVTGGHSQWYFVKEMLTGNMPQFGEMNLTRIKENPNRVIPIARPQETVALGLVYSPISVSISSDDDEEKLKQQEEEERRRRREETQKQKAEEQRKKEITRLIDPNDLFQKRMLESANAMLRIDDTFYISGRGLVVTGCLAHGQIREGDLIHILGESHQMRSATVEAIEMDRKLIKCAQNGDSIGLLLSPDVGKNDVKIGHIIINSSSSISTNGKKDTQKQTVDEHSEHNSNETTPKATVVKQEDQYTPESEFELGNIGEDYFIRKYIGKRSVVSIPPEIRGRKVVAIGKAAFGHNGYTSMLSTVEAVIIPDTVQIIEDFAFAFCGKLKTVELSESVTRIGSGAFRYCKKLERVVASDKITIIDAGAFLGCHSLRIIDFGLGKYTPGVLWLPSGVKEIGANAFTKDNLKFTECIFGEVNISKKTKVRNAWPQKTFDPKYCAIFYYD